VISGLHRKEINVSSAIFPQSLPLQPRQAFPLFPASQLNLMQQRRSCGRGASKTTAERNAESCCCSVVLLLGHSDIIKGDGEDLLTGNDYNDLCEE
jgi:hypothetical protein